MDSDDPYATEILRLTTTRCFTVEAGRSLGLPGHVLRRSVYRRSSRSIRFLDSAPPSLSDVVACLGTLSPGTVASHETAAALWGLPLPLRPDGAPIHLTRAAGAARPRRAGVVGHLSTLGGDDVANVYGVPLLRPGVDSAPESVLRLLILAAGLPEPEVNRWILDEDGRRVSRPDLQYRPQRIALEYEGEHHLTNPRQWARDIERDDRLRALGWTVLRFTKQHLGAGREDAMARIRHALAVAGQRVPGDRRSKGQK